MTNIIVFVRSTEDEKHTLTEIINYFEKIDDENLLSIVKLCEGSDTHDVKIFMNTTKVTEFRELKEIGSNITSGLGFPGTGYALVICEDNDQISINTNAYIQTVYSYMEGYSVEHHQITPAIYLAIKAGMLDNYFTL